jgi:hypothetical protein
MARTARRRAHSRPRRRASLTLQIASGVMRFGGRSFPRARRDCAPGLWGIGPSEQPPAPTMRPSVCRAPAGHATSPATRIPACGIGRPLRVMSSVVGIAASVRIRQPQPYAHDQLQTGVSPAVPCAGCARFCAVGLVGVCGMFVYFRARFRCLVTRSEALRSDPGGRPSRPGSIQRPRPP